MKELYEKIHQLLTDDSELRALLAHGQGRSTPVGLEGYQGGETKATIRRGFQVDGTWSRLLTYYFQSDAPIDVQLPDIRDIPLVVNIMDRTDDLNVMDIKERVIKILHDAEVTKEDEVFGYACIYIGDIAGVSYDNKLQAYRLAIRFRILARKERT